MTRLPSIFFLALILHLAAACEEKCYYEYPYIEPPHALILPLSVGNLGTVPLEGVLVFGIDSTYPTPSDVEKLEFKVFDDALHEIAGTTTVELNKRRVVWRSTMVLLPATQYVLVINGLNDLSSQTNSQLCSRECGIYSFKTATTPQQTFDTLKVSNINYQVHKLATSANCCQAEGNNMCGDYRYRGCEVLSTRDVWRLDITLDIPANLPHAGYLDFQLASLGDVTVVAEPTYLDGFHLYPFYEDSVFAYDANSYKSYNDTITKQVFLSAPSETTGMFCFTANIARLTDQTAPGQLIGDHIVEGKTLCIDKAELKVAPPIFQNEALVPTECEAPLFHIDINHPGEELPVPIRSLSGGGLF